MFSGQIFARIGVVDRFGFHGLGLVFFFFFFEKKTSVVKCGLWAC